MLGDCGAADSPGGPSPKLFRPLPIHKPFWRNGQDFGLYCSKDNPGWSCRLAQGAGPEFNPLTPGKNWGWREQGHPQVPPPDSESPAWGKMVEIWAQIRKAAWWR